MLSISEWCVIYQRNLTVAMLSTLFKSIFLQSGLRLKANLYVKSLMAGSVEILSIQNTGYIV